MKLSEALAAAQAEFPAVKFDAVNSHFGSRYATLHALLAAVRPALNGHGIFLSQNIHTAGHALYVTTELTKGDEVRRFDGFGWPLPEDTTPQKLAAASTYLKRIALQAALAHHAAKMERAVAGLPDAVQPRHTIQINQDARLRQAEIHHRHQTLATSHRPIRSCRGGSSACSLPG